MTFLIESLVACALFTLFVFLMSRNPIKSIFNYPPAIIERCDQLGLVDASNRPGGVVFYVKKIFAMMIFGVLLGLLVRYVNGCETFLCGALTAYALWVVVNWFDALVLDCLWFCHDKHFIIPGTEDMTAAYHDYRFHIKGALIGMLLGIPAALVAGGISEIPNTHTFAIRDAIERQIETYPKSTLQDIYKSFYQDRFGPGHMITDTASARQYLLYELSENEVASKVYFESVGSEGRYVRVYLSAVADSLITSEQLLDAFVRSANTDKAENNDWEAEWNCIVGVITKYGIVMNDFDKDVAMLNEASRNRQAVHHSRAYSEAYHPHYRIVERSIFENELRPLMVK